MWQELEAGRPVAAYTMNRGGTGERYDVFALVTPVADGYLSVRLRPGLTDVEDAVRAIYDEVAAHERNLRDGGMNRRDAAERGGSMLVERLAEHGYGSITDFTRALVPRELAVSLGAIAAPAHARNSSGVGTAALMSALFLARDAASRIDAFLERLAEHDALAQPAWDRLAATEPALARVNDVVANLARVASLLDEVPEPDGQVAELADLTRRLEGWNAETQRGLEDQPGGLVHAREAVADLGLRISTCVLLGHTVAQFIAEVLAAGQTRGTELRLLAGALRESLSAVDDGVERVREALAPIPGAVEALGLTSERSRLRLEMWRSEISEILTRGVIEDPHGEVASLAEAVAAGVGEAAAPIADLSGAASTLRRASIRLDTATVRSRLDEIDEVLARLP